MDDPAPFLIYDKAIQPDAEIGLPNGAVRPDVLQFRQLQPIGAASLPPRPWAYGRFLLFGSAAVIGAVDGGGKGAIAVIMALAMITGRPLLGEKIWRTGPVAIITYEDDEVEWHRRIAAACQHYSLDYSTVLASIHFIHKPNGRVSFAATQDGQSICPDGDGIIRILQAIRAALLIVDPFNHAHELDDGNSNVLMARVAGEMTRVAFEAGVAVMVLHHLRKGSNGAVDDLMGATSLRATFRSCRILSRMTPDEAATLNVTDHWRHLRVAGTKENYAPPPDLTTWFKLEGVELNNGSVDYPDGDNIAVATVWTPPKAFDGLDAPAMTRIFARLREGPGEGWFYSPRRQAKHSAAAVIVEETEKSPAQAATILRQWIENGVVIEGDYKTPNRNDGSRVVLNDAKVAEMMAAIRPIWMTADGP